MTTYTVRVVGTDRAVGEACTVCTTSLCLYVHQITQITRMTYNYSVLLTAINPDGTAGLQNSTTIYGELKLFSSEVQGIFICIDRKHMGMCLHVHI